MVEVEVVVVGAVVFGRVVVSGAVTGALRFSNTLPLDGELRSETIVSVNEVIMNKMAAIVVALERTVAVPRGPKTV